MQKDSVGCVIDRLDVAAAWLIEFGTNMAVVSSHDIFWREIYRKFKVLMWVGSRVNDGRYRALFRIKDSGINYDIYNICDVTSGAVIRELWIAKVIGQGWFYMENYTKFYIVDKLNGTEDRKIHSVYFDYLSVVNDNKNINISNPRDIYDMNPYLFPKSYAMSDLYNFSAVIDDNHEYVAFKVSD